ncbi:hypothetical protein [Allisonella histaminiformans]|uniref:hypothetical protein n=1 Tax=Allisonella histaminiformans TaxID=209880 RepID=UPI002409FC99|nr:hypothetical protein [Allisonella histaminiformans]MDD6870251.1 hypothetical protein [Allisonella histaminiformans]
MHKTSLYYGSLAIVLAANLGYHLVSRSIPVGGNQFLGIAGAYLLASVLCFLAGVLTRKGPLLKEWKETPLHYLLFGLFVPGLEAGFILMYHNGWQVSQGALVADILTSTLLAVVGVALFHDRLAGINWVGILLCFAGVIMVAL